MHQAAPQPAQQQPMYWQQPQTYQGQPVMSPYIQPTQQPAQQPVYQQPRVYRGQPTQRHGEVRQPRQRENRGVVRLDSWYASQRMNDPLEAEEEYAY